MSHPDSGPDRQREQAAFLAYWNGGRRGCFVMARSGAECDCGVFLPTRSSRLGLVVRSVLIRVASAVPPSQLKVALLRWTGMKIGRNVYIAPGAVIDPLWPCLIDLGDGVILGMGCRLLTHEYSATEFRMGCVRIGKQSVIGAGATVRCGITIGRRVTVGCNSFVNADVGDDETVGGVPAKPIVSSGVRHA